ncbi:unnamed protein product [Knipowitschia caucasica]
MRGAHHRPTMKKIYIGKTALKVSRNGGKHPKKSSLLEQKEDLRKRLSYTTHKLELLQNEFDSTKVYLETELRRAQEELDKFTDKLRRIQSGYSALQRINQDLEEKIHRDSQHHDDEKRALSREIIVLNNRLVEAKLSIDKLQDDNEMYRKDCSLATQLLQCRAQMDELPADFQEHMTLHLEEEEEEEPPLYAEPGAPLYAEPGPPLYAEPGPPSHLEKPERCSSHGSRSPSPSPPTEHTFILQSLGGPGGRLGLRAAYKSDLYSSDTALYCPDDRQRERRPSMDLRTPVYGPQNSTDSQSNPEDSSVGLAQTFSQDPFSKFPPLGTGSSSYSSFSVSEDKPQGGASSTGSSPQRPPHTLYMEWRDAAHYDEERKSESSWDGGDPDSLFCDATSFQQGETHSPVYSRTMSSCFSEPYEPLPPSSSPSVAYGEDSRRGSTLAPEEEELICRWRQLSAEDLHRSPGRASPYSFSEQHFCVRPAKIRLGPVYSSFQDGADYYHLQQQAAERWAGAAASQDGEHSEHMYRAEEGGRGSQQSLYHSPKDREGAGPGAGPEEEQEYQEEPSPCSSTESLCRSRSVEMAGELQHYQAEMHSAQASPGGSPTAAAYAPLMFGTLGLTRKDSLTKAQLYGTLLN